MTTSVVEVREHLTAPRVVVIDDEDTVNTQGEGNSNVVLEVGVKGPKGDKGDDGLPGGSILSDTYTESPAALTWMFPHGLGAEPDEFVVIGDDGCEHEPKLVTWSASTGLLQFEFPVAGTVTLRKF